MSPVTIARNPRPASHLSSRQLSHKGGQASHKGGFTLIELLVVIFIIGILIAATLTIIPVVRTSVNNAQTLAQESAMAAAIQQYYNDFRAYPGPLSNAQLYSTYDSNLNPPSAQGFQLMGTAPFSSTAGPSPYNPPTTVAFGYTITGSQNLVLGLLGGLELSYNPATFAANGFVYKPDDIFTDGVSPAPRGPASLNPSSPRRQQSYIQVKKGDLSTPSSAYMGAPGQGASFADSAGRSPFDPSAMVSDAMIPVFLDKYSEQMPILYFRANAGGTAIVGFRSANTAGQYVVKKGSTTPLTDPTITGGAAQPLVAQYDLTQNILYTTSGIGTKTNNPNSVHGLQGVTFAANETNQLLITTPTGSPTPTPPVDSIDYTLNGKAVPTNAGLNALAYFKDPSLNSTVYDGTTGNTHMGSARQKDGFILISAGPDGLYGTHDDVIYPGPLQP